MAPVDSAHTGTARSPNRVDLGNSFLDAMSHDFTYRVPCDATGESSRAPRVAVCRLSRQCTHGRTALAGPSLDPDPKEGLTRG